MAKCIGCGSRDTKKPHTYCRRCRDRVRNGITCDLDDVPTEVECRKACKAMDAFLSVAATTA